MDAFVTMTRKNKLIISDVKTRVRSLLPTLRNSRASEMQLSLYYQLLSNMIDGVTDMGRVYSEMSLDAERCFSDGFLAEARMLCSDAGVLTSDTLLKKNNLNVFLRPMLLTTEIMASHNYGIVQPARLFKHEYGNRLSH